MQKHCFRNILVNVANNVAWASKRSESETFFASETQTLHLQHMILAKEEAFRKLRLNIFAVHFKSALAFRIFKVNVYRANTL